MGYQKIIVDNPKCSRRFHISFDTEQESAPKVELKCLHCGVVVFSEESHPPAHLVREENLVKTSSLSDRLINDCEFRDETKVIGRDKPTKLYE